MVSLSLVDLPSGVAPIPTDDVMGVEAGQARLQAAHDGDAPQASSAFSTRGASPQHEGGRRILNVRNNTKQNIPAFLLFLHSACFMTHISYLSSDLLSYLLGFVVAPVLPVSSCVNTRYDEALEVRYSLLDRVFWFET